MSKVAATYLDRKRAVSDSVRRRRRTARRTEATSRPWLMFAAVAAMMSVLCLAVNYRAYADWREGSEQHRILSGEVEKLSVENLSLQEEIHNLRSDSDTIEREARKIGMSRPNEKILVPAE